jgi:hypothetical protein
MPLKKEFKYIDIVIVVGGLGFWYKLLFKNNFYSGSIGRGHW